MGIRKKSSLNIHMLATLLCVPVLGLIFATAVYAQCPDVSYWKLDEDAIGTYVDVIGGYDGSRAGKAPEPSVDFVVGGAQDFDGVSTGIDIPADAGGAAPFDWAGNANFTIEFWIKRSGAFTDNEVVIGRADGNILWWAGLWGPGANEGKAAFILRDSNNQKAGNIIGSTVLNNDVWHHVAIVRDGSNTQHRLYVDGSEDVAARVTYTAGTYTGNFVSDTAALTIGYLDAFVLGGSAFYSGTLDELALYDNVLSPTDILQHFDNGDLSGQGYCGPIDPLIVSTANTTAIAGFRYIYDVNATGEPLPTFALTDQPDTGTTMTIDSTNGVIEWIPEFGGGSDVSVNAENGGTTDTQNFTITVDLEATCNADLFAYWKLDEDAIGTYVDVIGGYDGARGNNAPEPSVDFKVGGAQDFDGVSTGIDIPADAGGAAPFDWAGNADFTIEFWIKRSGAFTDNEVVIGRADGNITWWAGLWGGADAGKAAFILRDSNNQKAGNIIGSTVLNDDVWHHVAIVRDGSNTQHRLYVDGSEDVAARVTYAAGTYTGNFVSDTAALTIGYLDAFVLGGSAFYSGTLDELALYDNVLSPTDILQHFNNGNLSGQGYCELATAPAAPTNPNPPPNPPTVNGGGGGGGGCFISTLLK